MSSPSSTLADTGHEDDVTEDRFFVEVAPFLFLMTKEDNSEDDDDESQDPDSPDSFADSASSDKVPGPEEDTLKPEKTQVEEVRAVDADTEFLEDIGLTPQAFIALVDGTDEVQWSEGEAARD
jgi:hypothetical protein